MCHLLYKINQKVPNKSIVLDIVGVHPDPSEPKMMACFIWKKTSATQHKHIAKYCPQNCPFFQTQFLQKGSRSTLIG